MQLLSAQAIAEAANMVGCEVEVREKYSGRGMFGDSCAALVGDLQDIIACVAHACFKAGYFLDGSEEESDLLKDCRKLRWDNMGRSDSVVY